MLAKLVTYVRETWGNIDVALPIHTKNTIAVESNTVLKKTGTAMKLIHAIRLGT